uniref:Phytanoyl-CoA hydroxylase-interacting protein-like C-terminal domain-containing protein n=1 Tax=Panagrolaimus sp. ES5 TaxID=591445 RepID=A0AC34G7W2_9BILA
PGRSYFFEIRILHPRDFRLIAAGDIWFRADKLEWKKFRQQVIVHKIPSQIIIRHTLVNPPIDFVTFDTSDAQAYDIQVSLIHDSNGQECIARGFIKLVAAKRLAINKTKFKRVQNVPLTVSVSAVHCIIEWPEPFEAMKGIPRLRFWSNGICSEISPRPSMKTFEIRTIPGRSYFFEIRILHPRDFRLIAAGDIWFRAVHSQQELAKLYSLAEDYCSSTTTTRFSYFYRTKPKSYFNTCMEKDDAIMKIYTKDESGHSASPLNSKLDGLFFYAKLNYNGTFPEMSPFGDTRWFIRAENLFDPEKHRLYFADFYYSKNNSFLEHRFLNGAINYFTSMKLWVEFYFTEDLPLLLGNFKDVIPVFQGTSTIGGVPNNKHCNLCNLYPDLE